MNGSLNCYRGNLGPLLRKIFWLLVLFFLIRVLFIIYNYHFFSDVAWRDTLHAFTLGLRVDGCLTSLICLPMVILYLLPINRFRFVIFCADLWFFAASTLAILVNIFDIKYFPFTMRRLGGEIFSQGELFREGLGIYWGALRLYWHLILCALILVSFAWVISFKITAKHAAVEKVRGGMGSHLIFFLALALTIVGIRGGFQGLPLKTTHLPTLLGSGKTQFIANNSCLNVIQTRKKTAIPSFQFFPSEAELEKKFNPMRGSKNFGTMHGKFAGKNVVVLILESFTAQNIGFLDREYKNQPGRTFTPFLDELLAKSLCFDGFSNGLTSIDGFTSVAMGIPPLLGGPFVKGAFTFNKIESLPKIAGKMGYATLFLYGGKKNSCNFDSVRVYAGIEKYIFKRDFFRRYPHMKGTEVSNEWGVDDEEWLQFVAECLSETRSPFCAIIFTLSSHYPFKIPKKHGGKFPAGEHPLQEVTAYSDFALRRFFESAQRTDWYKDTIFVLVADHTSSPTERYYQKSLGGYSIPLAIFDPSGTLSGKSELVAQQIDIMPTILDLIGYDGQFFSFGCSLFEKDGPRFAVSYKNGLYQIITDKYVLQFDGKITIGFYLRSDFLLDHNLVHSFEYEEDRKCTESFLKAFLQQYSHSLRMNRMTCE